MAQRIRRIFTARPAGIRYPRHVEAASATEEFLRDPVGRYVVGRHFFIWCRARDFPGSVLWGRPEERDTLDIVTIWRELHPTMSGFDVVTDGSRIESIDGAA